MDIASLENFVQSQSRAKYFHPTRIYSTISSRCEYSMFILLELIELVEGCFTSPADISAGYPIVGFYTPEISRNIFAP